MTLLLKLGAVVAVAAVGGITVLYLEARTRYRDRLRRGVGAPLSS